MYDEQPYSMQEFFSDVLQYSISVISFQTILLGGSALMVILYLVEKFVIKRSVSLRAHALVVIVLFLFAEFQAWQQEFKSRIGREKDLAAKTVIADNTVRSLSSCRTSLQETQDQLNISRGALDSRGVQITGQQTALSQCLVELGKANTPEAHHITAHLIPSEPKKLADGMFERSYIVATNKTVSPIRLLVQCTVELLSADGRVLGTGASLSGGWGGRMARNAIGVGIVSPAWPPLSPLLLTVKGRADPSSCGFTLK